MCCTFSLFKPSLNLLFFLLCPRSECLRISLARLRDDCLPVFVTRTLTDRMSVLGEGCLGCGVGCLHYEHQPRLHQFCPWARRTGIAFVG
jgi:hypothetical protein